ncbi:hypothetical protein [Geopseudomonas aromaticivorans]
MARSTRKTPIYGITTARSEAEDKRLWHGRMRASERERLHHALADPEAHLTTLVREVSNRWSMDKDGRQWWPWHRQALRAEQRYSLNRDRPDTETIRLRQRWLAKQRSK